MQNSKLYTNVQIKLTFKHFNDLLTKPLVSQPGAETFSSTPRFCHFSYTVARVGAISLKQEIMIEAHEAALAVYIDAACE